jgi:NAD-dependent dihydropyrimidine dehydrogenase PreA subunit
MANVILFIEQVASPTSIRCEYCAGCDHCTIECPGLRHDIEPVRAFRERHGLTPKPRNCTVCGEPEWSWAARAAIVSLAELRSPRNQSPNPSASSITLAKRQRGIG